MRQAGTSAHLIARNSLAGVLRYALSIPVFLITIPLILGPLGPDRFAIWALVGVLTAYAGLADLGIASGLVRFAARAQAEQDSRSLSATLSTVLGLYLVLGAVVSALLIVLAKPIVDKLLQIPQQLQSEAVIVVWGAAAAVFASLIFGAFGSVLQGTQRLDLWNVSLLVDTLVTGVGSVVVVRAGFGLPGLVLVRLASTSIAGLLSVAFAFRIVPSLRANPKLMSASIRREVLGYSANIFVARVAALIGEPLVRVLIARLAALASVTPFDIAARAVGQLRGVFSSMLVPLLPASAHLQTAGEHELVNRLYERSTRVAALSGLSTFSGVAAFSQPLVLLWLGPGNAVAGTTVFCLALVASAALVATPAFTILEGTGHARWNALTSSSASLLGVLLSATFGYRYGYWGVVLGYAIASLLGSAATVFAFHRGLGIPFHSLGRSIPLRLPVVCAVMVSTALFLQRLYSIDTLLTLAVAILVFYVALTLALLLSRSTSLDETFTILRLFKGGPNREASEVSAR